MENPEEVLQALDEFQKLKPSEIPRELEDYLCFVAKTGDPVYQWSLIKPLFREKLVRVMTDFYESCPTLDLAPSPNIEQFNYDSMKGNLLDLLESFANAPFTVQRICELLTAPRKEYNRVDKFMRAIEKNILVVSTKEPGSRRSENGDSMINGSMDDEPSANQSNEVEMESWVKDCTQPEVPLVETVIPSMIPAKLLEKDIDDKTKSDDFISQEENSETLPSSQTSEIPASDVPEAIMNEDTSSQPSLETETEESEQSGKKLQTTFCSKDFVKETIEEEKMDEKIEESKPTDAHEETSSAEKVEETVKMENDIKTNYNAQRQAEMKVEEEIEEKRARLDDDVAEAAETDDKVGVVEEEKVDEKVEQKLEETVSAVDSEAEPATEETETVVEEKISSSEVNEETDDTKVTETISSESPKVIVEEPPSEDIAEPVKVEEQEEAAIVIQEAMDDDVKSSNSMVPDPIPIVEEPKEEATKDEAPVEEETAVMEEAVETKDSEEVMKSVEVQEETTTTTTTTSIVEEPKDEEIAVDPVVNISEATVEKIESMEIDSEESTPAQEPMEEEESSDQLKS
uniref:Serine/threonine-protein phosphatase 4 regulatory subunit 2 n=1 Tax=Bracon brevicornis TaxID=1563983 RepID=A0A6V7M402_9HYME